MALETSQTLKASLKTENEAKDFEQTCYKSHNSNSFQFSEIEDVRKGHWTHQENMLYIMFLEHFEQKFRKRENRRLWKIFKLMSGFIQTRSPNQCRSHHQKTERSYSSVIDIVNNYKGGFPNYQTRFTKIKSILNQMSLSASILADIEPVIPDQSDHDNYAQIRLQHYDQIKQELEKKNNSKPKTQNKAPTSFIRRKHYKLMQLKKLSRTCSGQQKPVEILASTNKNFQQFAQSKVQQSQFQKKMFKVEEIKDQKKTPILVESEEQNPYLTGQFTTQLFVKERYEEALEERLEQLTQFSLWTSQLAYAQIWLEHYLQSLQYIPANYQ